MRTTALSVLIAAFAFSTLTLGAEDGDACNNCDRHPGMAETSPGAAGHAHGDRDDRHDGPDSPCQHDQDFHCCCSHSQAMIGMAVSETLEPVLGGRIVIASQDLKVDPSPSQTFHIPIA